jgi:hypothetical protein
LKIAIKRITEKVYVVFIGRNNGKIQELVLLKTVTNRMKPRVYVETTIGNLFAKNKIKRIRKNIIKNIRIFSYTKAKKDMKKLKKQQDIKNIVNNTT